MKNLVFISIFAFILACSKDDDQNNQNNCVNSNCWLVEFKPPLSIEEAKTTIIYNSDGSIKQVIEIDEGDLGLDTIIIDHTYYPNYFVRTYTEFSIVNRDTFYFDSTGKITKIIEGGSYTLYSYNASNQLITVERYNTSNNQKYESSEYIWENDKIVKVIGQGLTSDIEYYSEEGTHPIYNFQNSGNVYNFGTKVKYLIKKIGGIQFFGDLATIEVKDYIKDDQCNVIKASSKWTILGTESPWEVETFKWECL